MEIILIVVDLQPAGFLADRHGVSAYPEGVRRQHHPQTVLPPVCQLLLFHHLHRILQREVNVKSHFFRTLKVCLVIIDFLFQDYEDITKKQKVMSIY